MKLSFVNKIITAIAALIVFLSVLPISASAQVYYDARCCNSPIVNPRCVSLQLSGSPSGNCVQVYCTENEGGCTAFDQIPTSSIEDVCEDTATDIEDFINPNIFGITLRLDSDRAIQQIMLIGFTAFLAVAALAAVLIGLNASIQRATADSEDKVASTAKMIQNSFIGFAIIIVSIVIVQLVGTFLGIGNILQLATVDSILPDQQESPC